ncbi:hypothetical protein RRF57_001157 [Xylaria bambusicola]|uniref:Uncharacterized protein n=1 Tax=Xylaria bambusicola TaxID=326684 RepID=A0AAN7UGW9_9PEZI
MRNVHNIIVPPRPRSSARSNQDRAVTQYRELRPKFHHEAQVESRGQTSKEPLPVPQQLIPKRSILQPPVPKQTKPQTSSAQSAMSQRESVPPALVRPEMPRLALPQPALVQSMWPQQAPPYQIPRPLPPYVPDLDYTYGPAFRPEDLHRPLDAVPRVTPGFPPIVAQPRTPGVPLFIQHLRRLRASVTAQEQQEFILQVARAEARHSGDDQLAELIAAMILPRTFQQRGQSRAGQHALTWAPITSGVQRGPTGRSGIVQGGRFASYPPPNHYHPGL